MGKSSLIIATCLVAVASADVLMNLELEFKDFTISTKRPVGSCDFVNDGLATEQNSLYAVHDDDDNAELKRAIAQVQRFLREYTEASGLEEAMEGLEQLKAGNYRVEMARNSAQHISAFYVRGMKFGFSPETHTLASYYASDFSNANGLHANLSVEECEQLARKYAVLFKGNCKIKDIYSWFNEVPAEATIAIYSLTLSSGPFTYSGPVSFSISRTDGRILTAMFPTHDIPSKMVSGLLPEKECIDQALESYSRYKPFKKAAYMGCELHYGQIVFGSIMPYELSDKGRREIVSERRIVPYYLIKIADIDSWSKLNGALPFEAPLRWHGVCVIALPGYGTLIRDFNANSHYGAGQPTEGKKVSLDAKSPVEIVGAKGNGRLAPLKDFTAERPEGQRFLVKQGKIILDAVFDSKETVYVCKGPVWQAYKADGELLKAVKEFCSKKLSDYGKATSTRM